MVREILINSHDQDEETKTQLVFRNSPAIVRLAEAITSSGATLFTTFENPLLKVSSVITAMDEALAQDPIYWKCGNDIEMCKYVVLRTTELSNKLKCPLSDILIVAMSESLLPTLVQCLNETNKRYVQILHRGDIEALQRGAKEGAIILSHPDYVGGLEFMGVLIVGVDEGRVPPSDGVIQEESKHFLEFKACNRLYVAISRARLAVEMFYNSERGTSSLMMRALSIKAITQKDVIL
jgi:hypothetical protein